MSERKMIYLCLAHMSEDGMEQKYVKEAFDTNWVVPMGPNVNAFEKDLEKFVNKRDSYVADPRYDSNFWLCAATLDADVKVVGQEHAYKEVIKSAVGGAAGVIKQVDSATTDCQPNDNVEALRVFMLDKKVECRPVWKPMHKQPVYLSSELEVMSLPGGTIRQTCDKSVTYTRGVEEELFKVGFCLPAGPYVTDEDVKYIVECIKEAIC